MNLIEICIAFIVAIVSIGTPLVFQVISKFEEKYQSEKIIGLFKKESLFWLLKALLIASPIFVLFYIIISYLLVHKNNEIFSVLLMIISLVLFTTTMILVFQFIYFSFKVLKYSSPSSFIKMRINFLKKSKYRIEQENELSVVTNFFQYSIQKELVDASKLIPDYFFYVFFNYRAKNRTTNARFPEIYYETTNFITRELVLSESIRLKDLDYFCSGFYWLVGSAEDSKIASETYGCLWSNLSMIAEYGNDNKVLQYWKRAFHHFDYNLKKITPQYKSSTNREQFHFLEITEKENQRLEFLDFHYYLGGLLLYKNRIESIRKIWDHTTSEPPRYPLLPSTMGEIFNLYFEFCQSFNQKIWGKALRYNFPGIDSINFDWMIHSWIRKYLILLFIRQYTLQKYYVYEDFLSLPKSPESQAEKKHWIENIQGFIKDLEEVLNNEKYIEYLQFDHIKKDWCEKKEILYPLEFADQLKYQLEKEFEQAKVDQPISPEKEKKFWESSKKLISEALEEYSPIIHYDKPEETLDNFNSFFISGTRYITPKSDFADNQEYDHFNYDSFIAENLSNKIRFTISETFESVCSQSFLLKEEDLFPAIDRMKIEDKPEDFIIISFGQNIEYYIKVLNVPGLNSNTYKGVKLIDILNCSRHIVGGTFFILKKSDLPSLSFKNIESQLKAEYKEEENILENIYASVIDLHKSSESKEFIIKEGTTGNLEDKVLVSIEMNAEITWKKSAKVVAIRAANSYEDLGLPNKLEEVNPFDEI